MKAFVHSLFSFDKMVKPIGIKIEMVICFQYVLLYPEKSNVT